MRHRFFGETGLKLSEIGLGGLLARYEGVSGHPPAAEKRRIYLEAASQGVNLFDMGYGDERHIPDELKGNSGSHYFALKAGAPTAESLLDTVTCHLRNVRRDAIDILRVHYSAFRDDEALRTAILRLKESGQIRFLCLIRHYLEDQESYVSDGPVTEADGDLVMYNYVYRWQSAGIERAASQGKGVLIMKALGGQWIGWDDKIQPKWAQVSREELPGFAANKEKIPQHLNLVHPVSVGPWHELAEPCQTGVRTSSAVAWVLRNEAVSSVLVAVASVSELSELLEKHCNTS